MPLSLCCRYMQLYHAISLWNIKTGFQHLFCPCVLDVGNIIDSDLPGKITFIQPANDGRQVLLVDIAEAYGASIDWDGSIPECRRLWERFLARGLHAVV